jgi:hypothetical protein
MVFEPTGCLFLEVMASSWQSQASSSMLWGRTGRPQVGQVGDNGSPVAAWFMNLHLLTRPLSEHELSGLHRPVDGDRCQLFFHTEQESQHLLT